MEIARFKTGNHITASELEKRFRSLGLNQTMKGTLKSLPDNIHWHLKRAKQPGVCEITWTPHTSEIIIDCKKNRQGDWIEETALHLQKELKR